MDSNATAAEETEKLTTAGIVLFILALILSVFIISVNVLAIVVISRTPNLRTLSNIYVVSLAVADTVVGICLIPLSLFFIPALRVEHFDRHIHTCVLFFGINIGMVKVSSLHMVLIAIDRYLFIIRPYTYTRIINRRVIFVFIGGCWLLGIIYGLLPQIFYNEASRCDITQVMPMEYLFITTSTVYTICVVVDVIMYTQVLYTAHKQRRSIEAMTLPSTDDKDCVTNINDPVTNISTVARASGQLAGSGVPEISLAPTDFSNSDSKNASGAVVRNVPTTQIHKRKNKKAQLKSVTFFLTVFGVYFVCLTPIVVCMGVDYFVKVNRFLFNLFNLLAILNSGMNFIIFLVLNAKFRFAIMNFFRRKKPLNFWDGTDGSMWD